MLDVTKGAWSCTTPPSAASAGIRRVLLGRPGSTVLSAENALCWFDRPLQSYAVQSFTRWWYSQTEYSWWCFGRSWGIFWKPNHLSSSRKTSRCPVITPTWCDQLRPQPSSWLSPPVFPRCGWGCGLLPADCCSWWWAPWFCWHWTEGFCPHIMMSGSCFCSVGRLVFTWNAASDGGVLCTFNDDVGALLGFTGWTSGGWALIFGGRMTADLWSAGQQVQDPVPLGLVDV